MWAVIKFIYIVFKAFKDGLNPNLNSLRYAPVYLKYFTSIILACFWCLAFGLFFGELLTIGYNMIGHIALITMAFSTGFIMNLFKKTYEPRAGQEWLRMPDRSSRCDEMTEQERLAKIKQWNNRDIWNDPVSSKEDAEKNRYFYGS
jgi:hypothetical protein